jgi:elongation factor P
MITSSDLKRGLLIELEGVPYLIETLTVTSPSGRAGNTIYKVRLRNLLNKQKIDKSYRGGDTFAEPDFEKRPCQLLYRDASGIHFMDQETYEQFTFQEDALEWELKFLVDNLEGITALYFNEAVIGLELPNFVNLKITETAPGIKGSSATARSKPATLETGLVVQIPEYIDQGETLKIDTRTGESLGRA